MAYSPLTDKDISTMLKKIDVSSIEELFKGVPEKFKINFKDFGISEAYSEQDLLYALNSLGNKNLLYKKLQKVEKLVELKLKSEVTLIQKMRGRNPHREMKLRGRI